MHAIVHSADVQDRDGGLLLLSTLLGRFPYLEKLFADSAYQGPIFADGLAKILRRRADSATRRRWSTSRNARTPPSDDNKPPSNLTSTRLPETGDNPGNGDIGSFMAGAASLKSHESA
jgi:hypothetical protein